MIELSINELKNSKMKVDGCLIQHFKHTLVNRPLRIMEEAT